MSIHYLGIRHHGPGCARAVESALKALRPDCILIEGPPEGTELMSSCLQEGFSPPISLLAYASQYSGVSCFWPFSEFSPEWLAMRYAIGHDIHCAFIDLPVTHQLALNLENQAQQKNETDQKVDQTQVSIEAIHPRVAWAYELRRDPLSYLATLAREGELDLNDPNGAQWWEEVIEGKGELSEEEALAFFVAVAEMMQVLRDELDEIQKHTGMLTDSVFAGSQREKLREAYMRKLIKKHSKGHQRVVVICGAWHVPALQAKIKASQDQDLLKGLPKEKITCLWVPWSEARLAHDKGYAAGLKSPAWNRYLWKYPDRDQLTEQWLTDAIRLLRKEGFHTSSAHTIEAVRLATALAALREHRGAHLEDLNDALVSTLGLKDPKLLDLLKAELISGTQMGKVPSKELNHPLIKDFERQNKQFRLKLSDQAMNTQLDLRKELHQKKSAYLHQLILLNIPWGTLNHRAGRALKGTALEEWTLIWEPEWMMKLIDAGSYGDTIKNSATELVKQRAQYGHGRHQAPLKAHQRGAAGSLCLSELTQLLWLCLRAQLNSALPTVLKALGDEAGLTRSLNELLDAVPELIWMQRYQHSGATGIKLDQVPQVIQLLLPRIFHGLADACVQLSEELTSALCSRISSLHRALMTSSDQAYLMKQRLEWRACLERVMTRTQTEPRVRGLITRTLFEQAWWSIDQIYEQARISLSARAQAAHCIAWLEGFLTGGGLLLIYHDALRKLIDRWVCSLNETDFISLLPLLRRAFTQFTYEENRQLGEVLRQDPHRQQQAETSLGDLFPSSTLELVAGYSLNSQRVHILQHALQWLYQPNEASSDVDDRLKTLEEN